MIPAPSPGSSGPSESNKEVREDGIREEKHLTGDLKEGGLKWVEAAQDKRSLKKYDVVVKSIEGKHRVVIPEEVLSDATPLWEDFVVGKFLDIAPHIAKVHMVVNKIWKYGDPSSKVEVYDVNATTMRFKIKDKKAREKIIKRGMWNIAGVPMIVKKWTPKTEEEKQEEEVIPMWVHLSKVPLHLFSWEVLSFMTSTVGFPVYLHPETLACSNFEEAKVFVNVDVSKPLPKEIDFVIEGKEFTAQFYYPWLPSRCNNCEKWGHSEKVCVMKKRDKKQGGVSEKVGSPASRIPTVDVGIMEVKQAERGDKEGSEDIALKELIEGSGSGSVQEKEWLNVSPDKVGRASLKTPRTETVAVISASKFSVLSVDEIEEGEMLKEDLTELEDGNNEEDEELEAREEDMIEDELLDQKSREKEKAGMQKGGKRVQKPKAPDVNLKSKRVSRRRF